MAWTASPAKPAARVTPESAEADSRSLTIRPLKDGHTSIPLPFHMGLLSVGQTGHLLAVFHMVQQRCQNLCSFQNLFLILISITFVNRSFDTFMSCTFATSPL